VQFAKQRERHGSAAGGHGHVEAQWRHRARGAFRDEREARRRHTKAGGRTGTPVRKQVQQIDWILQDVEIFWLEVKLAREGRGNLGDVQTAERQAQPTGERTRFGGDYRCIRRRRQAQSRYFGASRKSKISFA